MPTARQLIASRCPECSAPVDLTRVPADVNQIRCAYCGTHLTIPKHRPAHRAPEHYRPPVRLPQGKVSIDVTPKPPPHTGNAGCGIVAALLIFGVMLLADVTVFHTLQSFFGGELPTPAGLLERLGAAVPASLSVGHLYDAPVLVHAANDSADDPAGDEGAVPDAGVAGVLLQARADDDAGMVVFFDAPTRTLRWRAPGFSQNFNEIQMTSGPRFVYVADQGRLTALDRETGEQAWQISLANPIANVCADCLQYMAGYVVALTRDGTLQSFEAAGGLPAWSRRFSRPAVRLHNVGGQPAVVDADANNRATFYMLDRITGNEFQAIQPVCTEGDRTVYATPAAPFVVSADGLRLHVLGSGSLGCVWRFNLVTGEQEWLYIETQSGDGVDDVVPFTWTGASFLLRKGVLYTTQGDGNAGVLRAVDSATSAPNATRELLRAEQHELTLEDILETEAGDTLVTIAHPTFARHEPEIWGIGAQDGARRWQLQLDMTHAFDTLLLRHTPAGLFVGQCLWQADECRFEVVDPATGVTGGQTRHNVAGSVSGLAYSDRAVWLNIWGDLHAVDLSTAQVEFVWP